MCVPFEVSFSRDLGTCVVSGMRPCWHDFRRVHDVRWYVHGFVFAPMVSSESERFTCFQDFCINA